MRGITLLRSSPVRYARVRSLTGRSVRFLLVAALLIIGSCPEILEVFPHRHLGMVEAGHDATPLEALAHLLNIEMDSAHQHTHNHTHGENPGDNPVGVSLVSPTHGSVLGLIILIPSWLTVMFIAILIARLSLPDRKVFAGCSWPPLSPPPQSSI